MTMMKMNEIKWLDGQNPPIMYYGWVDVDMGGVCMIVFGIHMIGGLKMDWLCD